MTVNAVSEKWATAKECLPCRQKETRGEEKHSGWDERGASLFSSSPNNKLPRPIVHLYWTCSCRTTRQGVELWKLYCVRANTQKYVGSWIKSGIKFYNWMEENSGHISKNEKCCGITRAISFQLQQYTECLLVAYLLKKASLFPQNYFTFENVLIAESQSQKCFMSHEYNWKDFSSTTS